MKTKELKQVLEKHRKWLRNSPGGVWANLREADLREADLCGANLYRANLREADLREANLCGANLYRADLREANLCGANLRGANLYRANLYRANLCGANLCGANLYRANLRGADLCEADLREADLRGANLYRANLRGANLCEADLRGANLPSPTTVLGASWGELSDKTTIALMRLDASGCPNGTKRFNEWAKGGGCPYDDVKVGRIALFCEKRSLWKAGRPPSIYKCLEMVLDEKCPGWRGVP